MSPGLFSCLVIVPDRWHDQFQIWGVGRKENPGNSYCVIPLLVRSLAGLSPYQSLHICFKYNITARFLSGRDEQPLATWVMGAGGPWEPAGRGSRSRGLMAPSAGPEQGMLPGTWGPPGAAALAVPWPESRGSPGAWSQGGCLAAGPGRHGGERGPGLVGAQLVLSGAAGACSPGSRAGSHRSPQGAT